jgi:hypothetical protein
MVSAVTAKLNDSKLIVYRFSWKCSTLQNTLEMEMLIARLFMEFGPDSLTRLKRGGVAETCFSCFQTQLEEENVLGDALSRKHSMGTKRWTAWSIKLDLAPLEWEMWSRGGEEGGIEPWRAGKTCFLCLLVPQMAACPSDRHG